ncbi:ATP-dependent helicase C-terminal domain-containing protein, partial [Streptomyces albidoflavus]
AATRPGPPPPTAARPAGGRGGAPRWAPARRGPPRVAPAAHAAAAGLVAALAFPERLARARAGDGYLMVSGTGAELGPGSALRESRWLAVAVADRPVDRARARVRLAAPVDEATARWAAAPLHRDGEEIGWTGGDVVARRVERLGAVELAVRPLTGTGGAGQVRAALLTGLEREGLGLLRWSREAAELRQRLAFLHRAVGGAWPDVSEQALLSRAEEWLEPELGRARRRADLGRVDAGGCLRRLLPWAGGEAGRLDELAPERLEVPSGSRVRLDYTDPERPVLAVKLQELFGLTGTPLVAGVPVLVHLLSPAGRPAAVTADLASFWADGYRAVRAELRGRYPKHPWPENPATATPTRHTKARAEREGRGGG